jgi:hypothetical protein
MSLIASAWKRHAASPSGTADDRAALEVESVRRRLDPDESEKSDDALTFSLGGVRR